MMVRLPSDTVSRVVVVMDHQHSDNTTLNQATDFARNLHAELLVLFVEDESLLRAANMPFTKEIARSTGVARNLDVDSVTRQIASTVRRLNRLVELASSEKAVKASLKVVRGRIASHALTALEDTDVVFVNQFEKVPMLFRSQAFSQQTDRQGQRPRGGGTSGMKPVAIAFDGSDAAARALAVAAKLAEPTGSDLIVILLANPAIAIQAQQLRHQANQLLTRYRASVRYLVLKRYDIMMLRELIRTTRSGSLIVSAGNPMIKGMSGSRLIDALECPVILVR